MAEKTEVSEKVLVHAFEMICPKCRGRLSISVSEQGMRPPDWPPNALGVADCNCQKGYFVKLSPELENAIMAHLEFLLHGISEGDLFVKILRNGFFR